MSQQQKMQTVWQLAKAVQQMHDRHMLKLNIKPETVLLDDFGDVVLSGVGTLPHMPAGSQSLPSCHGADNLRQGTLMYSLGCLQLCCISLHGVSLYLGCKVRGIPRILSACTS